MDMPTTTDTSIGPAPVLDMGAYEATPELDAEAGGSYTFVEGHTIALASRAARRIVDCHFADTSQGRGAYLCSSLRPLILWGQQPLTTSMNWKLELATL